MAGNPGYLPCFSLHLDKEYPLADAYQNDAFVGKNQDFLQAVVVSRNVRDLQERLGGHIQHIDPNGDSDDKALCRHLRWTESKVYRVDYGNNAYRLCFGLDGERRRCYVLALDSRHKTRGDRRQR